MHTQLINDDRFENINLVEYGKPVKFSRAFRFKDTRYWVQTYANPMLIGPVLWFYLNRKDEYNEIEETEVSLTSLLLRSYCISFSDGHFDNLPEDLQEFLIFNMDEFVDNHGETTIPRH